MFHYVFFRRLLLAMLAIVAACSLSIYLFSVPLIKKTVYTIEKDSAQTILENVYPLLQSEARAIDAYRAQPDLECFGGEEFVLILPGASLEDSCRKADELRRQLRETAFDRNLDLDTAVTISAGVAAYPQSGKQADHILEAADKALHQAKAQGRDRVVVAGTFNNTDTDPQA